MQLGILQNKLLQFRKDHKGSMKNMEDAMISYEHIEAICKDLKEKIFERQIEKSQIQEKLNARRQANFQQPPKSVKGPWQTIINANKARKAARAASAAEPGAVDKTGGRRSNQRTRTRRSKRSKQSKRRYRR